MEKYDTPSYGCMGFLLGVILCVIIFTQILSGERGISLWESNVIDVLGRSYTGYVSVGENNITISVDNPYRQDQIFKCEVEIPHDQVAKIERVKK